MLEKPDLIARLFNEKFEKQKLSLGEITTLISERQKILGRNLKTLDYQICEIGGIKTTFNKMQYIPDLASFLKDKVGHFISYMAGFLGQTVSTPRDSA